jgi:glucose-1-phosphate thymidylyltransferase
MKCLILAGGFATRLYPLTHNRAKALIEYKGNPLLTHLIHNVPRGIDILVTANKKFEEDFNDWQQSIDRQVKLLFEEAKNSEQKRGAISALNVWIKQEGITDDLLVIAGDNYFGFDLSHFIDAYNGKNALVAVHDLGDLEKASHFGVVQLNTHKIETITEKPANPDTSLIATACYLLPPRVFSYLHQYCSEHRRDNLGNFISYLIAIDRVDAYTFKGEWFDIGTKLLESTQKNQ